MSSANVDIGSRANQAEQLNLASLKSLYIVSEPVLVGDEIKWKLKGFQAVTADVVNYGGRLVEENTQNANVRRLSPDDLDVLLSSKLAASLLKCDELTESVASLEDSNSSLNDEILSLNTSLSEASDLIKSLEAEKEDLTLRVSGLTEENSLLKSALEVEKQRADELKAELLAAYKSIESNLSEAEAIELPTEQVSEEGEADA